MDVVLAPLQAGVPGAIELLIILLVLAVLVLIPTVWVYRDAKKRGMNAPLWAVVVGGLFLIGLVPGLLALVVYLWKRNDTAAGGV